jgi:hypothetical protein
MLESAFWGEPDMVRVGRPAKSVENDPKLPFGFVDGSQM